jgi:hypothetical protein
MNAVIIRDISPSSPFVNRRFGGTYPLHLQELKLAEQETRHVLHEEQKKEMVLGRTRPVLEADALTPSVNRLCRQYGIPNISQPYRPPRPVIGMALFLYM